MIMIIILSVEQSRFEGILIDLYKQHKIDKEAKNSGKMFYHWVNEKSITHILLFRHLTFEHIDVNSATQSPRIFCIKWDQTH